MHRRDEFRASKIMLERAQAVDNIDFKTPFVPEEFVAGEDGKLEKVRLRHVDSDETEEIEVGGAFVGDRPYPAVRARRRADRHGRERLRDDA